MTRRYNLADARYVDIFIWKPEFPRDNYPTCKYLIRGLGDEKIREVSGVDGVDAMVTALQTISIILYNCQEYQKGQLTWLGETNLGLQILHK